MLRLIANRRGEEGGREGGREGAVSPVERAVSPIIYQSGDQLAFVGRYKIALKAD
jgi:hypothetical protein